MKNKTVVIFMVFIGSCIMPLFSSNKSEGNLFKQDKDTLVVESEELPPFCYFDENNHLIGYMVELIDSIAQILDKPVKFRVIKNKECLLSHKMTKSDTRRCSDADILFLSSCNKCYDLNKYHKGIICFHSKHALMVRQWSGIEKMSDLSRKKIATYTPKCTLNRFQSMGIYPKLPLMKLDSLRNMTDLLYNKSADASIADIQVQKYILKQEKSRASFLRLIPLEVIPIYYQLMVHDDSNRVTVHELQMIISTFNRDKTILKLQHKWFDFLHENEILTLNRLLSIILAILIIILLAFFFVYLGFVSANIKENRYYNLMIKMLDVFPYAVKLSEIDRKGEQVKLIYSNHKIKQNLNTEGIHGKINYSGEDKLLNTNDPHDPHLISVDGRYFKKRSLNINQTVKVYKMDIYSDVTEIIMAKEKSDLTKKLKNIFLANMSHDIRTPLNTIVGFSQLLTETQSREELLDYSQLINDNTYYLVGLIDDIVKLTHYKNGMIELYEENVDLVKYRDYLLMLTNQSLKKSGKENKINLVLRAYYSNIYIRIDWRKYLRVIMNMITNSIKFTDKGYIEAGSFIEDGLLYFYVEDTGIGIAEDKIPIIFNAYESIDSISKSKGTGLGMAICIAIIKRMGGTMGVYSKVGEGSLFWCSYRPHILETKLNEDEDYRLLDMVKEKIKKSYVIK